MHYALCAYFITAQFTPTFNIVAHSYDKTRQTYTYIDTWTKSKCVYAWNFFMNEWSATSKTYIEWMGSLHEWMSVMNEWTYEWMLQTVCTVHCVWVHCAFKTKYIFFFYYSLQISEFFHFYVNFFHFYFFTKTTMNI